MENLKIGKISSSGQKQGENTKIQKFSQKSGSLGSYDRGTKMTFKEVEKSEVACSIIEKLNTKLKRYYLLKLNLIKIFQLFLKI